MAPKAEIGFCDFKVNSVIEGFSQSIEWKLNIWFNTSPTLRWSPRIKTPSEAVKTQNETPGSQALAAHAGLHWGVRSPIWPKVFLKLSWLSFVLAAVIYVWSLSSIHCFNPLLCFHPLLLLWWLQQPHGTAGFSITIRHSYRKLRGTASPRSSLLSTQSSLSPLLLLCHNHSVKHLQVCGLPGLKGEIEVLSSLFEDAPSHVGGLSSSSWLIPREGKGQSPSENHQHQTNLLPLKVSLFFSSS